MSGKFLLQNVATLFTTLVILFKRLRINNKSIYAFHNFNVYILFDSKEILNFKDCVCFLLNIQR